jgi:hypothetical protein
LKSTALLMQGSASSGLAKLLLSLFAARRHRKIPD